MEKFIYSSVWATIELLQKCLKGPFLANSLEENQKLLEELEDFQCIIFDRHQRYGNPNYREQAIEKELKEISLTLRSTIATQLTQKIFDDKESPEEIFRDFEYVSRLNSFGSHRHTNWCCASSLQLNQDLHITAMNYLARLILERTKEKKKYRELLKKVQGHYNGSNNIYKQIEEILAK